MYTGKIDTGPENKGVAHRIVIDLLNSFLGKGHWVFTDNYYSSPELFLDILNHGTYVTGTVRSNRKHFPQFLKDGKMEVVGSYHFATSRHLVAARWRDRRDVFMLSTAHNTSVDEVLKRPKGSREKQPVPCPMCVSDYNAYMGGGGGGGGGLT